MEVHCNVSNIIDFEHEGNHLVMNEYFQYLDISSGALHTF